MIHRSLILAFLTLGCLFAAPVQSQETYLFNRGFRPDYTYSSRAVLNSDMNMEAPGGLGGMKGSTSQEFSFRTTAGSPAADGTFEIAMVFEKGSATIDMRGMKQTVDLTEQLSKMTIRASCSADGTVETVKVQGLGVEEMLKQLGPQLLKDNQIHYPKEPMSIGSTFHQTTSLSIPLQGVGSVEGIVESTFKLASVEGDLATFEITQNIGLERDAERGDGVQLEGSGTGSVVYSFTDRFERSARQTTTMNVKLSTAGNAFSVEVASQLEQHNTLSPTP